MSEEPRTRKQLRAELVQARKDLEQSREGAAIERGQARAERSHLQDLLADGGSALANVQEAAKADRTQLRGEMQQFKREVGEQLTARDSLQRRHERIIAEIPVGIAYLDAKLAYTWANPTFARLVNLPPAQLVNLTFPEVFPDAYEKLGGLLREAFQSGQRDRSPRPPIVYTMVGKDGESRWDLLAIPMLDENNVAEGILVAIEVTGRVERERLQQQKIDQMIQLERLKGDLISMVSHELRTPLSTISGFAELLEDNLSGPLNPEQLQYVSQIQAAEGRIRHIVDELLDFARIEMGNLPLTFEPIDLGLLLEEERAVLLPQHAAAGIRDELVLPAFPVRVRADRARVAQVIRHLIGNAIKFSPAGGGHVITLSVAGHEARVSIADRGIGIDADQVAHLFERFFQADQTTTRPYGGVGLGLATSKQLVELQGGKIGVESELGVGSTFWFTLPLVEDPAPGA